MDETLIWNGNWAWALPLIFLTVVLHVTVLGLINTRVVRALRGLQDSRKFLALFVMVMGVVTMLATVLHALEAGTGRGRTCGWGRCRTATRRCCTR